MLKDLLKRRLAILLAAVMLIGLMPLGALAENSSREPSDGLRAGTVNPGVTGLSASYDNGTWSANSSAHSINGSVKTTASSNCGSTTYTAVTGTLTLKNTSGAKATLSFTAAPVPNGGSVKINGVDAANRSYSFVLAANETVAVVLTSCDSAENTTTIALTNIALVSEKNVNVTFTPAENGSYTVDGAAITSSVTLTKKSTESFAVSATPATGYVFAGWILGGDSSNVISTNAADSLTFTENVTVTAYFIDASTAVFDVGGKSFYSLPAAVSYAQANSNSKITLVSDGVLPEGSYTIPNGITLLIPFDAAQTVYTSTPTVLYNSYTTPTAYKTLTMASGASITVQSGGAICLGGNLSSKGQMGGYNGTPTGPDGRINMLGGSSITLNSGANLYCWGYIYGGGSVEAESGSTVYEAFQIKDWRGGTATSNVYDYAFIFNQYYIQNVEVPLKVYAGASVKLYSSVNASSSAYPIGATLIGANSSSGGMFYVSSGYIIKDYKENTDTLNIEVHGNVGISSMTISGIPAIGTISTSNYILPITNNLSIELVSGTTTVQQDVEFLPGVELRIGTDATLAIANGKKVYVYDNDDWGLFSGTARMYPIGYSVANGTTAIRSASTLKDAVIDVNGTLSVTGSLFTSAGGADITSTLGTSGTNGRIVFSTAPTASTTIYECASNSTKTPVSFYAPHLHNGDDSYSNTTGTGTSSWYYDKDGEHWYRYTVDFSYNGSIVGRMYFCEATTLVYDGSWLTGLGASVGSGSASVSVSGTNVNVSNVTANTVVNLTGTSAQFIPTFVLDETQYANYRNYTGSTLDETRTINEKTYYVVKKADAPMSVGSAYAAPTDAEMGVTAEAHNAVVWNLSGVSATSGNAYNGAVPVGESNGDSYIYGFYTGAVAYNSFTDAYYPTLAAAMADVPSTGTGTVRLVADCGAFEEENGAAAYSVPASTTLTLDLNGHRAVGRIINKGTLILEMNGGSLNYESGATAAAAAYQAMAAVTNSGSLTVQDSTGGGRITADAISNTGVPNHSAVIRNYAGGTMSVSNVTLENLQNINSYVSVVLNDRATIAALTNVTILSPRGYAVFNYGGQIQLIDSCTVDCAYGIYNRNVRAAGAIANGYTIANYGTIGTIKDSTVTAGQYAIHNGATINELNNSTFTAHPDSAQVNTYGAAGVNVHGNTYCYTVYNSGNWWYDTNVWKQTDSSTGGYTRVNYYKEDEAYRPKIHTIIDCDFVAENTGNSSSHGYALVNYGVIDTIGGTTNIRTYKHPDNTANISSHYAFHNLGGGIVKSIEGTVNVSATGIGTVYNDGAFTTQINYTYGNKVGGNITYQKNTYGEPSTIQSITCAGTWTAGGNYYVLMNSGYIGAIDAPGLTLRGSTSSYNVLYNATGSANLTYEITKKYTDPATATTEYERNTSYVKNLEKGSTIGSINGITLYGLYYLLNNQGHIGTLSNVTASNSSSRNDPVVLNGDSRYASYTEIIRTNRTSETDPHLTVSAGIVTRYDRSFVYSTPTIDVIDNLTITSNGQYAFRNAGAIGTLKNSSFTATTSYALHNSGAGPYSERQSLQYYSGASIFTTSKSISEYSKHYKRNVATITAIDNCTFKTNTGNYAALNVGHIGTITNSIFRAGATTANAYALANMNSQEREYTRNLEEILYVVANGATSCTAYWGTGGESNVVEYDYDQPTIDLIGEGNAFFATSPVIANTGHITAIDSGTGTVTTVTGSTQKGSGIYNYGACLDSRTATTPYTAAASSGASGTAGTAVNTDVLLPGASIDTIKNIVITTNGYGILNGDAGTGKLPSIGELGDGLEIHANCTTAGYHAVYNQANAKITAITGGIYAAKTATTNAYKNNNTDPECATLISGGDFKGMAATRTNAIFEPDNTDRQTYPDGKTLTNGTRSVTFHDGTTADGFYYIDVPQSTYTVTWKNWDGTVLETDVEVSAGTTPSYDGATPTRPDTAQYTYTFSGWTPDVAPVSGDAVYTAVFAENLRSYTVTWKMDDGSVIDTTTVEYGSMPTHADPEKPDTAQYTYIFTGWTPDVAPVSGNAVYTAVFTESVRTYTIIWKNGENVLKTEELAYGATPVYSGVTPEKPGDAQYTYTFKGWTPEIVPVSGDAVYFAAFDAVINTYTVQWVVNGEVVETDTEVPYGTMPVYNGETPVKPADAQYTYTFAGWTPELAPVSGNATYTAAFSATVNTYTVTWKNYDGTVLETDENVPYGTTPSYDGAEPAREADAQYTYTFDGWDPEVADVTGDAVYTAKYSSTLNEYNVRFVDDDGNELQSTSVPYGEMPVYNGETPTKAADAQYTYTFTGWTPELAPVSGNATYTATFSTTVNTYTVTWKNYDGTVLEIDEDVPYGEIPAYNGAAPEKAADAQYTYTFLEWSPAVAEVTGDAVYTAVFTETTNTYTVTWNNSDGTLLEKDENVPYGAMPSYNGETPTKEADAQFTYTFDKWTPEIEPVSGNVTYTATYTSTVNTYTVTWKNYDGTVLETDEEVPYGTVPTYDGETPVKAADAQYTYTFAGWTPEVSAIEGSTVYTAVYDSFVNTYTVTFVDYDGTLLKSETVPYGSAATAPADPVREGYTFTGWDTDFSNVTSNLTVTAQYEENAPTYLKGDYDRNGKVNATDALLLLRAVMAGTEFTAEDIEICDMNDSGGLNATDALLILRYSMNNK